MAAPAILPASAASKRACSSIIPPRAQLINRTVGLTLASSLAPIKPLVALVIGVCTVIKSDSLSSWSKDTSPTPRAPAYSEET